MEVPEAPDLSNWTNVHGMQIRPNWVAPVFALATTNLRDEWLPRATS